MATLHSEGSGAPKKKDKVGWLDLPNKDQLFILSLCRLSEPLSNVCLLPYIFYLVRSALTTTKDGNKSNGAATAAEISAYSGILVASFSLAQFVASLPWGRLSDSYGRRFSVVIGIAISVVSNAAFGFSRSFGALLFWRSVAGLANANVAIMRTMTAEIVGPDRKFQTKAFLLLPLVFNSGMVLSLALGGVLAEPAVNLPWLVGPTVQWAIDYPYALPAVFNAAMLFFALLLAFFFLAETLAGKEEEKDIGLRIGHVIITFFAHQKASYQPLRESEDVNLDSPHPAQNFGLDGTQGGKETAPAMTDVPLGGPAIRSKPSLRSIFTFRTVAALVSFGLLPLHNSTFMV